MPVHRILLLISASLMAAGLATPAGARTSALDPQAIPYSPLRKALADCGGLQAGVSREWQATSEKGADGSVKHNFRGRRHATYPDTDLHGIVFHPIRDISISCSLSPNTKPRAVEAWVTTFAIAMRASALKDPGKKNVSALQPFRLPGIGTAIAFFWDEAGEGAKGSQAWLFGGFGGTRFRVFAQLNPVVPSATSQPVLLNPGSIVKRQIITGETISARLTAQAWQDKEGSLYPAAADLARQRAWLLVFFKSFRGPGK